MKEKILKVGIQNMRPGKIQKVSLLFILSVTKVIFGKCKVPLMQPMQSNQPFKFENGSDR